MTTATTKSKRTPAQQSAADMVQRRLDLAASERAAREAMLTEIVEAHGRAEFNYGNYEIARGHRTVFEDMNCTSEYDIIHCLNSHKATMFLREKYGDPEILTQAKAALAECEQAEQTARAELEDLDDVAGGTGPILIRQIKKMEARLAELMMRRSTAQQRVTEVEQGRKGLRDRAPEFLRKEIERELGRVRAVWKPRIEEDKLESRLELIRLALKRWAIEGHVDPPWKKETSYCLSNWQYVAVARVYRPQIIDESSEKYGNPTVRLTGFTALIERLQSQELPGLQAELAKIKAAWAEVVAEIEEPLERWCATGQLEN
jgi:hypothetical protein